MVDALLDYGFGSLFVTLKNTWAFSFDVYTKGKTLVLILVDEFKKMLNRFLYLILSRVFVRG